MNVLESPLEALAFNYVNVGILSVINNLWTWIAVLTAAAVSFWRIRAIGGAASVSASVKSDRRLGFVSETLPPRCEDSINNRDSRAAPSLVPVETARFIPFLSGDGITKGKFTVRYDDDGDDGELTEIDGGELTAVGEGSSCGGWLDKRVMGMRNGEDWCRCLDLTVINGNVVRLWDDGVKRKKARLDELRYFGR